MDIAVDTVEAVLVAAQLDQLAAGLRDRARLAAELAEHMPWHSLAGIAFRERAGAVCLDAAGLAGRLGMLADTIRATGLRP